MSWRPAWATWYQSNKGYITRPCLEVKTMHIASTSASWCLCLSLLEVEDQKGALVCVGLGSPLESQACIVAFLSCCRIGCL